MRNILPLVVLHFAFFSSVGIAFGKIVDVVITDEAFVPRIVVVEAGDRIRWINQSPSPEEPDSMPHGWDNPRTQPFRRPDYPELEDREGERKPRPIPPGGTSVTLPLTRVGWWLYHNHSAGSFWNGLVIIQDPISGEPHLEKLRQSIPRTTLRRGMRGKEVAALQYLLKWNRVIYPEGNITGYFGADTERAIRRFQERFQLEGFDPNSINPSGWGIVEERTRAKIREVFWALR